MTAHTSFDDDLNLVKEFQLDALERMQTDASRYVWRIVEEVGFLPTSGQSWQRQVQLALPSLPVIAEHKDMLDKEVRFIVSLGTFRRRRFADFTVTTDDGSQCHLLTRRQHGYSLATCLLRQFLSEKEWESAGASPALADLHSHISRLITTMPTLESDDGAKCAQELLAEVFDELGVADHDRRGKAHAVIGAYCESIAKQTQYLCWVTAKPGSTVYLRATYTQSDTPRPAPEAMSASGTPNLTRLAWRNWRTKQYARYNIFPQRYVFGTPAFEDCKSYYFKISPPADTRVALLDWGSGRRFRTMREDRHLGWRRKGHERIGDMEAEVDCADFAYHFYNRRTAPVGDPPDEENRTRGRDAGARLHAFMRIEPTDNSKLGAAGIMGLGLAVLAQRGQLFSLTSGASQWLLLAPGALVLFVTQQRRHHYARFTTPYRVAVWLYILLAMLFAGSVAFDAPALPLLGHDPSAIAPRLISGLFALGSGLLIIGSLWSGLYFEWSTRRRARRVVARVHVFSSPSFWRVFRKFGWKQSYWRIPEEPLSEPDVDPSEKVKHPSDKVYAAVARHGIDRALAGAGVLTVAAVAAMLFAWNWGSREECAIARTHAQQTLLAEGRSLEQGKCISGRWQPSLKDTSSSRAIVPPTHAADALSNTSRGQETPTGSTHKRTRARQSTPTVASGA